MFALNLNLIWFLAFVDNRQRLGLKLLQRLPTPNPSTSLDVLMKEASPGLGVLNLSLGFGVQIGDRRLGLRVAGFDFGFTQLVGAACSASAQP